WHKKNTACNSKDRATIHNPVPLQEKQKNDGGRACNLPIFVSVRGVAGVHFMAIGNEEVERGSDGKEVRSFRFQVSSCTLSGAEGLSVVGSPLSVVPSVPERSRRAGP